MDGACSCLLELTNQSRLGFSERGLKETGTTTEHSDRGWNRGAAVMDSVSKPIIFWNIKPCFNQH